MAAPRTAGPRLPTIDRPHGDQSAANPTIEPRTMKGRINIRSCCTRSSDTGLCCTRCILSCIRLCSNMKGNHPNHKNSHPNKARSSPYTQWRWSLRRILGTGARSRNYMSRSDSCAASSSWWNCRSSYSCSIRRREQVRWEFPPPENLRPQPPDQVQPDRKNSFDSSGSQRYVLPPRPCCLRSNSSFLRSSWSLEGTFANSMGCRRF